MGTHSIKFRARGGKAWWFLTSRGGGIRLRIHAARYSAEDAERQVAVLAADNPDHEFKAVLMDRKPAATVAVGA